MTIRDRTTFMYGHEKNLLFLNQGHSFLQFFAPIYPFLYLKLVEVIRITTKTLNSTKKKDFFLCYAT